MHKLLIGTLATSLVLVSAAASRARQSAPGQAPPNSSAPDAPTAPPKWEPVDLHASTFDLRSTTPQPPVDPNKPVPMSTGVMRSNLVNGVPPVYPADARKNKLTGVVVLHILIAKDGSVAKVDVISGPDEFRQSAIDAVKQWKYKPTTLNGTPVQVLTQVNLNFHP